MEKKIEMMGENIENKTKKLQLKTETLRQLKDEELADAGGGTSIACIIATSSAPPAIGLPE
jgi:hypothetical protein